MGAITQLQIYGTQLRVVPVIGSPFLLTSIYHVSARARCGGQGSGWAPWFMLRPGFRLGAVVQAEARVQAGCRGSC